MSQSNKCFFCDKVPAQKWLPNNGRLYYCKEHLTDKFKQERFHEESLALVKDIAANKNKKNDK